MFEAERLKKLHEFATKGDLSTAERYTEHEHIECPVCQGDGEVLASDYCNIDGKALGVQFYGIGNEFGAHEALWSYLVHSVPAILAMAEREKRKREAVMGIDDDYMTSEKHHPGYVLIPTAKFEAIRSALGEEKAS